MFLCSIDLYLIFNIGKIRNIHMSIKHYSICIEKLKGNEKVGLILSFLHCFLSPLDNIIIDSKFSSSCLIEADYVGRLLSGVDAIKCTAVTSNSQENWLQRK